MPKFVIIEYFLRQPYENCDIYQKDVKGGPAVAKEIQAFMNTPEYVAVSLFNFQIASVFRSFSINRQLRIPLTKSHHILAVPKTKESNLLVLPYKN